ncbi:MAG: GGDEF domain-containing protein [Pseudobutyrivibrio sp.]|nr:GGDEF domain-containing protein [Pseudobutyrivibrio sp.]
MDFKKRNAVANAVRSMYQMILLVNENTFECHVLDYNDEIKNITSEVNTFDEFSSKLYENIHPEDRDDFLNFTNPNYFPKELESKVYTSIECRIRRVDHNYYWAQITFCNATKEDSSEGCDYLFLIQDIHEMKTKQILEESELRHSIMDLQGKYDDLFEENMKDEQTGCYNRKGMKFYTDIIIDEAKNSGRFLFVCVADLNGLKHLNDTYGHAAGDEDIATVSRILLSSAPHGKRIVRTGGDEFLLMAAVEENSKEPHEMEDKIEKGLDDYNKSHQNPFTVGASYGWVLMPYKEGMSNLDCYVEIADSKMYEMKTVRDKYRRDIIDN